MELRYKKYKTFKSGDLGGNGIEPLATVMFIKDFGLYFTS